MHAWSGCSLATLVLVGCFSEPDVNGSTEGDESSSSAPSSTTLDPTRASTSDTTATTTDSSTTGTADTGPETGEATSETGTSAESGEMCPMGTLPAPPMPVGWSGPHVLFAGIEPAAGCPAGLQPSAPDAAFYGGTASCSCTCEQECNVEVHPDDGNACTMPGLTSAFADETCADFNDASFVRPSGTTPVGSCFFATPTPDPVKWQERYVVCESIDPSCVGVPPMGIGPCLRHDGDVPCGDDHLQQRIVTVGDVEPVCDACPSCGAEATAACSAASLTLFASAGCPGAGDDVPPGACSDDSGMSFLVDIPDADCVGTTATVTEVGIATWCCAG